MQRVSQWVKRSKGQLPGTAMEEQEKAGTQQMYSDFFRSKAEDEATGKKRLKTLFSEEPRKHALHFIRVWDNSCRSLGFRLHMYQVTGGKIMALRITIRNGKMSVVLGVISCP